MVHDDDLHVEHVTSDLGKPEIASGKVSWFDNIKGYGFIELDDFRTAHVHYSVIPGLNDMRYLMADDIVKVVVGEREEGLYVRSVLEFTRKV